MTRPTRQIAWVSAALKEFNRFPEGARIEFATALTTAAEGRKSELAKPLHGFGSGVFEIALPYRGDAYRVVYAVQIGDALWVVHAFQKKSTIGNKTSRRDLDVISGRLKRLKEN
jgi:phage-related protein